MLILKPMQCKKLICSSLILFLILAFVALEQNHNTLLENSNLCQNNAPSVSGPIPSSTQCNCSAISNSSVAYAYPYCNYYGPLYDASTHTYYPSPPPPTSGFSTFLSEWKKKGDLYPPICGGADGVDNDFSTKYTNFQSRSNVCACKSDIIIPSGLNDGEIAYEGALDGSTGCRPHFCGLNNKGGVTCGTQGVCEYAATYAPKHAVSYEYFNCTCSTGRYNHYKRTCESSEPPPTREWQPWSQNNVGKWPGFDSQSGEYSMNPYELILVTIQSNKYYIMTANEDVPYYIKCGTDNSDWNKCMKYIQDDTIIDDVKWNMRRVTNMCRRAINTTNCGSGDYASLYRDYDKVTKYLTCSNAGDSGKCYMEEIGQLCTPQKSGGEFGEIGMCSADGAGGAERPIGFQMNQFFAWRAWWWKYDQCQYCSNDNTKYPTLTSLDTFRNHGTDIVQNNGVYVRDNGFSSSSNFWVFFK